MIFIYNSESQFISFVYFIYEFYQYNTVIENKRIKFVIRNVSKSSSLQMLRVEFLKRLSKSPLQH